MQISRLQFQTILDNAPAGVDKGKLVEKYIMDGHNIEGIDSNQVKQSLQQRATAVQPPKEEKGFVERVSEDIKERGSNIVDTLSDDSKSPITRGFEATAEGFNAIGNTAYEALPEFARKGLSKTGEFIGKQFGKLTDVISDSEALQKWTLDHPNAAKKLEELASVGSSAGAISGNILLADTVAKVGQAGVNKTLDVGSKAVEKTGETLAKAGKKLNQSAYTPTAEEARLIQNNKIQVKFLKNELAKTPKGSPEYLKISKELEKTKAAVPTLRSDTALNRGLSGTEKHIAVQGGAEKLGLWKNKIEPALRGSKDVITKKELFAKAEARIAETIDPSKKTALKNALDSLKDDYKDVKSYPLLEANQLKTSIDEFTPSKIFKGQEVANELKTIKADMASAIREKTYSSLKDAKIKADYRDYANLKQLEKIGIKALTEAGTKGGFGGFWTTIYDKVATPIQTIGGKILYRVGNKLEFLGKPGVKTVGDHLKNLGFKSKSAFEKKLNAENINLAKQLDNETLLESGGKNFDKTLTVDEILKINKNLNFPSKPD